MSASHFCCTHPQQRIDTPEPPARPLANMDSIFAAAALPEDHPHALKLPDRKPGTDSDIVKSPNIASKIRMQFHRRSLKSLSKAKEYDADAQQVTSQDVLHQVLDEHPSNQIYEEALPEHRFGSVADVRSTKSPLSDISTSNVRTSVLNSLGYLRPLIQKPSDLTVSNKPGNVTDLAIRVATRQHLAGTSSENDRPLLPLPKSSSAPLLPLEGSVAPLQPRCSRSDYDLWHALHVPESRCSQLSTEVEALQPKRIPGLKSTSELYGLPMLHVQEPTDVESGESRAPRPVHLEAWGPSDSIPDLPDGYAHLHNMDISHQLRCMSQLSDVAEDEAHIVSPYPWNFHRRERSEFAQSSHSRHLRQKSSTGVDSASLPSAWGRIRTPSSIYSRPTSAAKDTADVHYMTIPDPKDIDSSLDYQTLFADWPLKPSQSTEEVYRKLSTVSQKSAASEHRNKPLPPTPDDTRKESSTASYVTATNNNDGSSIKWLSPQQQAGSMLSKDSSSILTKGSRTSHLRKFIAKFSPSKGTIKHVQKRRSTFRFLRPGSRRQQGRSISTPVLGAKPPAHHHVDGTSDDPALLTVQYELEDNPGTATRSKSTSYLNRLELGETDGQLMAPSPPQRRPSMAEYERKLSVVGDDRRRPSILANPQRLQEIQVEDQKESIGLRRKLSRASALKDDASPLMAQALEKHQQEKSLFRSASKARESLKSSRSATIASSALVSPAASDLQASSIEEEDESLDATASSPVKRPSQRSISFTTLLAPQAQTTISSLRSSTASKDQISPAQDQVKGKQKVQAPMAKSRIGTSLDSWSRYPSHTRSERCGSAGKADAVITRDFGVHIDPDDIQSTDDAETSSPTSDQDEKIKTKKANASLPKSRSLTFGTFSTLNSIKRYYSNMFGASGAIAQNRRTSVTTGGYLYYPELEMLPPPSVEGAPHHRHSHFDPFERLKEDAHIVKDYIMVEEDKLETYVRREEDKLKSFVHKEEDKIEGFVKKEEHQVENFVNKEEHKLKAYVKREEDKLHPSHLHRHYSGDQSSHRRSSPFQEVNMFGASRTHDQDHLIRAPTMVGPTDDVEDTFPPTASTEKPDPGLTMDGAHSTPVKATMKTSSKADLWSDVYKECILETPTPVERNDAVSKIDDKASMPPPALKPVKPRSPEQPKQLDTKATIRRFPSVTVIDDRKGHLRSVSLISVRTSKSANFECPSTADLLELLQAREREERDKLLK